MPLSRFSVRSAFAALSGAAVLSVTAVALVGKPNAVQAFPAYSQKEGVKCGYCHVSAKGSGPRNYRGMYYKKNGNSFANFDDAAEAKAAGVPVAPEAEAKPASLTAPEPAATPTPEPVASPAPVPGGTAVPAATAKLRANVATTAAALKKTPKNPAAKKAHSAALTALARGIMNDATIPPAQKYPEALRLSRQALVFDAANKNAAADVKRITDVYKQMGRPVPK